jgi:hypothetical protein
MPNQPKSNIRYRVSEPVAAELAHARRQFSNANWNDFFISMLRKWKETPDSESQFESKSQVKPVHQIFEKLELRLKELEEFLENQEELLQSVERGQEQIHELIQRMNLVLSLALEVSGGEESKAAQAPATLRQSVIQKIRRHRA